MKFKRALVTGSTGLLGSWLIIKLLKSRSYDKVYAIVRAKNSSDARKRLLRILSVIPIKLSKSNLRNLVVLNGDVSLKYLGMTQKEVINQFIGVTDVFHSAAIAEFNMSVEQLRPTNVEGTRNVLDVASLLLGSGESAGTFHHISTIATIGKKEGWYSEKDFILGQKFNNGYEESKYEAELLVRKFCLSKKLPLKIYRPGIITGDSKFGITTNFKMIYQPLHFMRYNLFSVLPGDKKCRHSFVPVDKVAEAIFILSYEPNREIVIFHIINPYEVTLGKFIDRASRVLNFKKPSLIPYKEFSKTQLSDAQWKLLEPFVPYFNYKARFDAKTTNKILLKHNFNWPKMDNRLLDIIFKFCIKSNFKPLES